MKRMLLAAAMLLYCVASLSGAELILPQNRTAFYSKEEIELAVVGLDADADATISFAPVGVGLPFDLRVSGSAPTMVLPPYALAPGKYKLSLGGKSPVAIVVARGLAKSTTLMGNQHCTAEN